MNSQHALQLQIQSQGRSSLLTALQNTVGPWLLNVEWTERGLRLTTAGIRQSTVTECVSVFEQLTVLSCYKRSISITLAVLYIELMAEYGKFNNEDISQHFVREKHGHSAKCKICKTEPSPAALKPYTNIYADFIACPY